MPLQMCMRGGICMLLVSTEFVLCSIWYDRFLWNYILV